ncbi:MAG TPA: hypothetical protein VIK08_07810 [Candidatus Limnocylindrales bacterium]
MTLLLHRSFYGHEDPTLRQSFRAELPGIFNGALEGLDRLRAQGRFTEPESSRETVRELEDLVSPVSAFVRDMCVVGPDAKVVIESLWQAWKSWSDEQGRHYGTLAVFGRDLRAAVSGLRVVNARDGDRRRREYAGLALRPNNGLERVPRRTRVHRGRRWNARYANRTTVCRERRLGAQDRRRVSAVGV